MSDDNRELLDLAARYLPGSWPPSASYASPGSTTDCMGLVGDCAQG